MNDTIRSALVTVIKSNRQKMSRAQRQRSVKPQRWLYPYATEKRYAATIRSWLRPMRDFVHQYLKENQEDILRGDSAAATREDSLSALRLDVTSGGSFIKMVDSLNGWMGQYAPEQGELFDEYVQGKSPIYMGLGNIADSTFDFNERQFEKGAKSVLGVEFPVGEDWWPDARENWKRTNYELMRGQMLSYIHGVNAATERAVTSGLSVNDLAKQIKALDDKMTQSKANFLARDQIGKLNGEITQRRMESAGLTMYIWETSGDERVRPSHELIDGGLCRWDDSAVFSQDGGKTWIPRPSGAVLLHPGNDYLCRCTAIAYWHELVEEADAMIAEYEELDALSAQNIAAMPKATPPASPAAAKKPKPVLQTPASNKTEPAKPANQKTTQTASGEEKINAKLSELRDFGKKEKRERASLMTLDGKVISGAKGDGGSVSLTGKMLQALDKQPANSLSLLHNHPNSTSFSIADFCVMCIYCSLKELRVVGSNSKTYRVSVGNGKRPSLADMEKYEQSIEAKIKQECANKSVRREIPKGESFFSLYISERNKAFAEKFGWEYKEDKLNG